MRRLIIHPGWSKTGTSAIQFSLVSIKDQLKQRGILYSSSLQEIDMAHHRFALAFQASGPYQTSYTKEEVIHLAVAEMQAESCDSLIISSEHSPFYFDYPEFLRFAESCFDSVEIMFTIRSQSDCLKSLYSQLVTDPNVRFRESLLFLLSQNIDYLNYYNEILRWSNAAGTQGIRIIPYSRTIVHDFIDAIDKTLEKPMQEQSVHVSINSLYLQIIQERCKFLTDPIIFAQRMNQLVAFLDKARGSNNVFDTTVLFSSNE
jgi:hypothetical protein